MSDQSTPGADLTGTAEGVVTPPVEAPVVEPAPVAETPAPGAEPAPVETPIPATPAIDAATAAVDHLAVAAHTAFLTSAEEKVRGVLDSILKRVDKNALIAEVEKLAADLKL